jgi:phage terminase large subunit
MANIERRVRWYQQPFHSALVGSKHDRLIEIAHRRWGKDEIALMGLCEIANNPKCPKYRIGNYWHCLPEYEQARKAIWEGVNAHTGKRRIDEMFPADIIASRDSTTMMIKFKSGSTYQLIGSDRFNATVGAGPVGIAYSEWALANPSAWAYHRPMIEENAGWAAFITTPRGQNHAKSMYDMAAKNMAAGGRWFAEISDVFKTGVLTQAQLEESLFEYQAIYGNDFGLAMFEQEYHCSFSGAMVGAIFGGEVNRAEREGRIGVVPVHPRYPVHTAWDLGKAVNNPIWCFQVIDGKPHIVDFYRPESDDLEQWCIWLKDKGYHGTDYVPHDAIVKEWGAPRTRMETLILLGRKPKRIPMVSVQDGLNAGNQTIRLARFDGERCAVGIDGLKNYRREWDDERKTFRENPVKDWAEHIGSSWRYLSLAWQNERIVEPPKKEPPKPSGYLPPLPMPDDHIGAGQRRIRI